MAHKPTRSKASKGRAKSLADMFPVTESDPPVEPLKLTRRSGFRRVASGRSPFGDQGATKGHTWLICYCGRLSVAALPGEDGGATCFCGRPATEMKAATPAQIDSVPDGVTVGVVIASAPAGDGGNTDD